MSRRSKNRQPQKTKPKSKPQPQKPKPKPNIPDNTVRMMKVLNDYNSRYEIVMEIENPNRFIFYSDTSQYEEFKEELLSNLENIGVAVGEDSFGLSFKESQ